jgi:ribose/xylose/arabinose/galactoside ABC-type transport system permease subunit
MERPTGTSVFAGLLTGVSFLIVLLGMGFALYSLSEWMTTGALYTGSRATRAWRTYEQDPQGFIISAVFCVAFVVMPIWYALSKRRGR